MSRTFRRIVCRHPRTTAVGLALAAGASYLNNYALQDHMLQGQSPLGALVQTLFLDAKKALGLGPTEDFPYEPEHLTAASVQHCLRAGGRCDPDVTVRSITKSRVGSGDGILGTVWCVSIVYDTSGGRPRGPDTVIFKLMNRGLKQRVLVRIGNVAANELFFYRDGLHRRVKGFRAPQCYFTGWRPGYQRFCLVLEDLRHLATEKSVEVEGVPLPFALATMRQIARFHAYYFNKVRARAPAWVGRTGDSTRYDHLPSLVKDNVDATLFRMMDLEKHGNLPPGTLTPTIKTFVRDFARKYYPTSLAQSLPVELKGQHNRTVILGDLRGGNMFLDQKTKDVILYDFQLCREGSPAEDIVWFLQSVSLDLFKSHGKAIVRAYHDELLRNNVDAAVYPWHRLLFDMAQYASASMWFLNLLEKKALTLEQQKQDYLESDPSNTAEGHAKVMEFSGKMLTRTFNLFHKFNTAKVAALANESRPGVPTAAQYMPLLPKDWL